MTVYDYALQRWLTGKAGAQEAMRQAGEVLELDAATLASIARMEGYTPEELRASNQRKMNAATAELGIPAPFYA